MEVLETLKTPVAYECDVLVAGGGFGGISAALAAARNGKKVILLEKLYMLGGLGTAGLITYYLPLCDGMGHQVSFGIAEELLRLSISLGEESRYPDIWFNSEDADKRTPKSKRYETQYNAQLFAILAEKLLIENGVQILYGTYAVSVKSENQKIKYVITENKSGREAISVKTVVDATGDCDIAHFADAPTDTFKQGNLLAAWYYSIENDKYKINPLGACDIPDDQKNGKNDVKKLADLRFTGVDGKELSDINILSHTQVLNDVKRKQQSSSCMPVTIATTPQVRMSRKIVGEYILCDKEEHKYFEDSIGMVSDWRKRGPVYEVPFGTLYSSKVKNLITAGRCTSVTEAMWDIMRVIPCCAVTGEAAGTAAALSDDFTKLDIKALQKRLVEQGVVLHEKDL